MTIPKYGVHQQNSANNIIEEIAEQISLLGYAVLDAGFNDSYLEKISQTFDATYTQYQQHYSKQFDLKKIDEQWTIRAPLTFDRIFLDLVTAGPLVSLLKMLIPGKYILNQQNGIINPANEQLYNQAFFHRDLPYQHWVSSKPLAINALFCVDDFTINNGATKVLPGSHKQAEMPSDTVIEKLSQTITAPKGSFLILDCMLYHSGGINYTDVNRRAINNVFTIPLIKQQIDLPRHLGPDYPAGNKTIAEILGYGMDVPHSISDYYKRR